MSTLMLTLALTLLLAAADERTRITDFDDPDANNRWLIRNDNVMGGRSDGGFSFGDGVMTFRGDINTDGGGFASVRLAVDHGSLDGVGSFVLRVKPDDRGPYRLLAVDADSRVLYRYDLPLEGGGWQEVTVPVVDMIPTVRGDPIDRGRVGDLDPADILEIGFILNDTGDGPFALKIDWIDAAR